MSIHACVVGRLGADAELVQAGSKPVLKLRLATSRKTKDGETTTWVGVSIWGQRAESLAKLNLSKGEQIAVRGELYSREHNGKVFIDLDADGVDLLGGKKADTGDTAPRGGNGAGRGAVKASDFGDDEALPF